VLACCLVLWPLAPAQHVHEIEEHGHHALVAHSHTETHHAHASSAETRLTRDDDDSVVLTLDPVFAPPHQAVTVAPHLTHATVIVEPPVYRVLLAAPYVERLIHAPPRAPAVVRGPPSLSLL